VAFTQADVDALDRAIADGRGARSIAFSDQSVTFHTVAEMLKLRAIMKREVDEAPTYRFATTDKGT
jgi:hypothetical protein